MKKIFLLGITLGKGKKFTFNKNSKNKKHKVIAIINIDLRIIFNLSFERPIKIIFF